MKSCCLSWINLNKTVKTKLKFRTVGRVDKEVYVVEKKAEQLRDKLDKLSEKQDNYPMTKRDKLEKQEDINRRFDKIKKI
jgi:hypothetical protein